MTAVTMRRAQVAGRFAGALLLGCVSLAIVADKAAQLSDEFLEYLGSLEGNDESWMDFAADGAAKDAVKPPTKPAGDSKAVAGASSSSSSRAQSLPQAASANTSAASQAGKVEK